MHQNFHLQIKKYCRMKSGANIVVNHNLWNLFNKLAKAGEAGKKASGSDFLTYSATPKTLIQKMFVSSILVILCAVVTIIALVLYQSRKSQLWTLHNSSKLQRHRGGNLRSRWKRYDGFQPLQQEELQGLGSALESEDEDLADSSTIINIRKLGLTDTRTNHIHNSKFSHHIDT